MINLIHQSIRTAAVLLVCLVGFFFNLDSYFFRKGVTEIQILVKVKFYLIYCVYIHSFRLIELHANK